MKAVKTILVSILALIVVLITIVSSVGCIGSGSEPSSPVNIAFVLGIADGETMVDEGITELSSLPALPGTDYAFISIEGEPACIGEPAVIQDYSDRGYTEVMMERLRSGIRADIASKLKAYTPSSPEIDMASAIDLAVRTVNSHAVDRRENILVFYCSGRSTAGLINMAETPVFKIDIESSVSAVSGKMSIDLSNIDNVIWYACGSFGGQSSFSPAEISKLQSFYNSLFKSLGLKSDIDFRQNLSKPECYCFADTPVSDIAVEGTTSCLREVEVADFNPATVDSSEPLPVISITEESIGFLPNKNEFRDSDLAMQVLQPIASTLIDNPSITIVLAGTTAGDKQSAWDYELSLGRASRIKQILCSLGVDEDRIITVGLGCINPWHIPGVGVEGPLAAQNRRVVILDSRDEIAMEILANQP